MATVKDEWCHQFMAALGDVDTSKVPALLPALAALVDALVDAAFTPDMAKDVDHVDAIVTFMQSKVELPGNQARFKKAILSMCGE